MLYRSSLAEILAIVPISVAAAILASATPWTPRVHRRRPTSASATSGMPRRDRRARRADLGRRRSSTGEE
eukprot:9495354-Pyramimonas_sp.AAC.1